MSTKQFLSRQNSFFLGAAGNHGVTSRLLYTIPSGSRVIVEMITIRLDETTAIAAIGSQAVLVRVNGIDIAQVWNNNTVTIKVVHLPVEITLDSLETLEFFTINAAATVASYFGSYKLREYQ